MNLWALGAAALTAGWFLLAKENRELRAGRAYKATFRMPEGMPELPSDKLQAILPPGAGISIPQGGRDIIVTFVAPRSTTMTDLQTPLGTLKLVSLVEMG